mmetsp:Transcript_13308/g.18147  ORF Transcript_13308/g.18147 Transcript_13308/m.18147 type:complete len:80 (+) Transcript_13308:500-739(+)
MPLQQPAVEVMAHKGPITRMRLGFYNDWLFTAGVDGCLFAHEVKEKDPRTGLARQQQTFFSDEILAEKQQIDETINQKT